MKKICGYTLLELLTCLLISSLLCSVAAPSFNAIRQSNQQSQLVNQLLGSLNFARSSAVFSHSTIGICSGTFNCQNTTHWSNQLLVFNDQNHNGQLDNGEQLLRSESMTANYAWYWSNFRQRSFLQFEQDGTTRALNGTLTLCRTSQPIKQLIINMTGRVRVQSPSAAARCS